MVLSAEDLAGDPVAIVHLPVRVPFGFHGNFVPDPPV
jgi:carotenoid cleavage dioxygenase